ncbi:hypothetical protein NA66_1013172 [Burkholderia pyrrocinia]|uniref:Glycosyl hydrolase n=2 Tax=Burkholderiaceae TaxID=119060 RepID=A0A318IHV5_BURPY|nr:hypothetical protein NA66_1013172 [Burkholderia pyrrocinia]SFW80060.1 hypothetical protein SAMN03159384_05216 [Burkholderia sp. NFACC33-1]SFY41003.1 hypothetical protein SAMN03159408_05005 [Burkholderia sp. NFPP32]
MAKHKRWKWVAGGLVALAIATYGYVNMTTGWETISTSFMRDDTPYGGGNFRINGNEVMSVKLAHPEVTFKPASELKDPQRAEPTEAWMNDTSELLNRMTVNFYRGTIDGGMRRHFQQPGQDSTWWYSKDWSTQFISTLWIDYKAPNGPDGFAPQVTKLWKSVDGGQTWSQVKWPENQDIGRLLFLDPQRGYAVGGGPHVWRTSDGGNTWQAIEVPVPAHDVGKPRKDFSAVNLGPDGVLRVVYYVGRTAQSPAVSIVDRLDWEQRTFVHDTTLPNQVVLAIDATPVSAERYSLYTVSLLDSPQDAESTHGNNRRTGAISTWANGHPESVQQLHTFDGKLRLEDLNVGRDGVLLVHATDPNTENGGGAPINLTFSSTDAGKTWKQAVNNPDQGGYFDPQTNTLYSLFAYTLKKRTF